MSEKIFFEEGSGNNQSQYIPQNSNITNFVIKIGLAQNEKQANVILIVLLLIMLGTSIWLVMGRNIKNNYVVGDDGKKYSFEEYESLSKEGKDPLLNNK